MTFLAEKLPGNNFSVKWLLLTITAFSYPLAALFGSSDGSVSLAALPTIVALGIGAAISIAGPNRGFKMAALSVSVAIFAFNAIVWLTAPAGDSEKFLIFNGVILAFGLVLALNLNVSPILDHLDRALIALGIIALGIFFTNISEYDTGRLTYGDSNPIWMGRLFGMACVAAIYATLNGHVNRALSVLILVPLFVAMVLTGSRGPVLAFLIAASLGFFLSSLKKKYMVVIIFLFIIFIAALIIEITGGGELRGLSFGQADDVSYFIRIHMFEYTMDTIRTFPYGIGIGNFTFMNFTYPHNIILEFLSEWGWLAGGAYILIFIFGGFSLLISGKRYRLLFLLFVFEIVNSCLSGDVTSPRLLYGLAIAGIALRFTRRDGPVSA